MKYHKKKLRAVSVDFKLNKVCVSLELN